MDHIDALPNLGILFINNSIKSEYSIIIGLMIL